MSASGNTEAAVGRRGLLARMRVRKKLMFLHTCFSLALAGVLLVAIRPAIDGVVIASERAKAAALLTAIEPAEFPESGVIDGLTEMRTGTPGSLEFSDADVGRVGNADGPAVISSDRTGRTRLAVAIGDGRYAVVATAVPEARAATAQVYILLVAAVLVVYGLIAAALEVFVLPQNVYRPIERLLRADEAVRAGDHEREIIADPDIPADELGEIMRSRNGVVSALRTHEAALAEALGRVETAATDLKKKNHLLETARRNLEGADRLASLGMMSAGIAHELNTPLSVAKGLVEKLAADPGGGLPAAEAKLLARVIVRLERLGESLLDFARARETTAARAELGPLVDEAITLVRLDRETGAMPLENRVGSGVVAEVDSDRVLQVFVNLIRNAVDAVRLVRTGDAAERGVRVTAERLERDGGCWVVVRVEDDGPGIDPRILPTLFEPFVSDKLDARGTGLGLAVADGIVREHGGTVIARNRPALGRAERSGAVFEVMLPVTRAGRGPGLDVDSGSGSLEARV
ncbi:MAG: ATP-binding protein [Planctomycetota bacterium]